MNVNEKDIIISGIKAAFAAREYPGDNNLAEESIGDPTYEGNCVANYFRGKSWENVTSASILADRTLDPHGFLYVLTPESFAYYMPAFLIEAMSTESAPDLAETLIFALSPADDKNPQVALWKNEHMKLFTKDELEVIEKAYDYINGKLKQM